MQYAESAPTSSKAETGPIPAAIRLSALEEATTRKVCQIKQGRLHLLIRDSKSGKLFPGMRYRIRFADGVCRYGVLDVNSRLLETNVPPGNVRITLLDHAIEHGSDGSTRRLPPDPLAPRSPSSRRGGGVSSRRGPIVLMDRTRKSESQTRRKMTVGRTTLVIDDIAWSQSFALSGERVGVSAQISGGLDGDVVVFHIRSADAQQPVASLPSRLVDGCVAVQWPAEIHGSRYDSDLGRRFAEYWVSVEHRGTQGSTHAVGPGNLRVFDRAS